MRDYIYTQAQCDGMSELEKNKAVAEKLGHNFKCAAIEVCESAIWVETNHSKKHTSCVNYLREPNDIMPIAFEHEISLIKDGEEWAGLAGTHIGEGGDISADICAYSDDPLTAIVDCFLQMNISNA